MRGNHLLLAIIASFTLFFTGCWWDDCGGGSPSGGFTVTATDKLYPNCIPTQPGCVPGTPVPIPASIPHPGAQVAGTQQCDFNACGIVAVDSYGSVYRFGNTNSSQSPQSPVFTDASGQASIANGRTNAIWQGSVLNWGNPPCQNPSATAQFQVSNFNPFMDWVCLISPAVVVGPGPAFSQAGSLPSSITISRPNLGLTTTSGMPILRVYNGNGISTNDLSVSSEPSCPPDIVITPPPPPPPTITATSVSSDGNSATFPFPRLSDGSPLPPGFYGFSIWNQSSSGNLLDMGMGFFGVGSSSPVTTPFGVDAVNISQSGQQCYMDPYWQIPYCDPPWGPNTSPQAIMTLSSTGKVMAINGTIAVGSKPTAIKAYGDANVCTYPDSLGSYQCVEQPSNAIVTNFGSNTVSILDLVNNAVMATITVGTQPVTVALNSNQAKAYVANYGSSTVSEIDLNTKTQSRLAGVGTQPAALAMQPGGAALWVGGLNYISKVDLTSLLVVQTFSVSGQVTSISVSSGQNSLVYTVFNTGTGTFSAQQAAISTGAIQATYAQYTAPSGSSYLMQCTTCDPSSPSTPPGWRRNRTSKLAAIRPDGCVKRSR